MIQTDIIKNLECLLNKLTKHKNRASYCNYCLQRFSSKEILHQHESICKTHKPQKITYPTENEKWLHFKDYSYQLSIPFVIYADFETLLLKMDTTENNPSISHTTKISHLCGFSYIVVAADSEVLTEPVVYRGKNTVDHFLSLLLLEEQKIRNILRHPKQMIITPEQEEEFQNAILCHICGKELKFDRVRDHCHVKGFYRDAAHNGCNLNYKISNIIPVIMHNLRGYDEHLIMSFLGKIKNRRIECIPNNMQKYISFSLGSLVFLDSLQFLNASFDTHKKSTQ